MKPNRTLFLCALAVLGTISAGCSHDQSTTAQATPTNPPATNPTSTTPNATTPNATAPPTTAPGTTTPAPTPGNTPPVQIPKLAHPTPGAVRTSANEGTAKVESITLSAPEVKQPPSQPGSSKSYGMPLIHMMLSVRLKEPPPAGGAMINLSSQPSGISPSAFRINAQTVDWPIAIGNHAFTGKGPFKITVAASSGGTKATKEITVQG